MNVENPKERRESGAQTIDSEVQVVNKEEVKKAFKKMKKNKVVGQDNIPLEIWMRLEEAGVNYLTSLYSIKSLLERGCLMSGERAH